MGHGVGTRMGTLLAMLPLLMGTEEKMTTAVVGTLWRCPGQVGVLRKEIQH